MVATEEATRVLNDRLDAIQERFERQLAEQAAQEDSAVSGIADEVSYESVMAAMETANKLGAVEQEVHVSGGDRLTDPVVSVALATEQQQIDYGSYSEPRVIGLALAVDTRLLGTGYVVESLWTKDDDPITVFGRLRSEMVRVGYGPEFKGVNVQRLFQNLNRGLEDAVAGRRGDQGAWRSPGTLLDVLSDDWVVSNRGIEHREHGIVCPAIALRAKRTFDKEPDLPPAPEWVDEERWGHMVTRARARLINYMMF
ncbi:hypothetical protein DXT68_11270 [Microbacterium foliorum]|nr:hypothetical protein DXT68_11270 [Microbacterium foliorum]